MTAAAWMRKAAEPAPKEVDRGAARRALELLGDPAHGVELRGLPAGISSRHPGADLDGMVDSAARLAEAGCHGVYYCLNPIPPGQSRPARDGDVLRRRWLLVDVDPVKPDAHKDDPATEQERKAACSLAGEAVAYLAGLGWPEPVQIDSGGGMHLLYRVDLANDEASKLAIKGFLARLSGMFSRGGVVDRKVFNASRIAKLPGTWALRGVCSAERPYRMASLLHVPEALACVTLEQIQSACQEVTETVIDEPIIVPAPAGPSAWLRLAATAEFSSDTWDRAVAYVHACQPATSGQGGHNTTLSVARGVVWGFGLGAQVGYALLESHYNPRCVPPWPAQDLRRKCEQAESTPDPAGRKWGYLLGDPVPEPVAMSEGEADDYRGQITRIADLVQAGSEVRWLWPNWIPTGVLTLLAAEGGVGKTRFLADLIRRIRMGLSWPDGQGMTLPPDFASLWVMSDNHHDEMVNLARDFGVEGNIWINSDKAAPYDGTSLDQAADLAALEKRIQAIKPALVIVDTVGNSTDKNLSRQEDAKAYYLPLQVIARRNRCAVVCATHLNAGGGVLGRRATEKVRCVLRMSKPDPDGQPDRRRLEIIKSNSKYPQALGITMGDKGNNYDGDPPAAPSSEPGSGTRGPAPVKLNECKAWLAEWLSGGPRKVGETRTTAEADGFSAKTLYTAMRGMGVVEAEVQGRKWWSLPEQPESDVVPVVPGH